MRPRIALLVPFAVFVLSASAAIGVWHFSPRVEFLSKPMAFRDFMRDVDAGKVEWVTIAGRQVSGSYRANAETFHTYAPTHYKGLANDLAAKGILKR